MALVLACCFSPIVAAADDNDAVTAQEVQDTEGSADAEEGDVAQASQAADDSASTKASSSSSASEEEINESLEGLPVTDGANAEKYLENLKGKEAVEESKDSAAQAFEDARGHWEYDDVETVEKREVRAAAQNPGNALAAAAVALSGYGRTGGIVGPGGKNPRHHRPPDKSSIGDWTVYNRVMDAIIGNNYRYRLFTDCTLNASLTIRWSGIDDDFPLLNTVHMYRYMAKSSKWARVGGNHQYFHRRSGKTDGGFELQPGDVMVGKPCQTEGRGTHIFIYTGTEIANMKYPGADYTIFESHMAKSWPGMQRFTPIPNGTVDYCVFRRTNEHLNIEGSRYAHIYPEEKLAYSPETKIVEEKSSEKMAVRYILNEYKVNYLGLPYGSSTGKDISYTYESETLPLANPLLPEGYVFDGWYTGRYVGTPIQDVAAGTLHNTDAYAHVHRDEIHQLEYYLGTEIESTPGIFIEPLRRTLPYPAAVAIAIALIAAIAFAASRRSKKNAPSAVSS